MQIITQWLFTTLPTSIMIFFLIVKQMKVLFLLTAHHKPYRMKVRVNLSTCHAYIWHAGVKRFKFRIINITTINKNNKRNPSLEARRTAPRPIGKYGRYVIALCFTVRFSCPNDDLLLLLLLFLLLLLLLLAFSRFFFLLFNIHFVGHFIHLHTKLLTY